MKAEFWHNKWEQRDISFHQDKFNQHLTNHWKHLNLNNGDRVFVPLSGKSLDMLWLLGEGHKVVGVELSPIAVKEFFSENQLKPVKTPMDHLTKWQCEELTIYCGDLFQLKPNDLSDTRAVFDRASMVALPPEMRKEYVKFLKSTISKDAVILLVSMEYNEEERGGPPFNVTEEEIHRLYEDTHTVELLERFDLLEANPAFKERGLTRLDEKIYKITPKSE